MSLMSPDEEGPRSGHLGTAWEGALVGVFVLVIFAILGATIFQMRRKQRRAMGDEDIESSAAGSAADRGDVSLSRPPSSNWMTGADRGAAAAAFGGRKDKVKDRVRDKEEQSDRGFGGGRANRKGRDAKSSVSDKDIQGSRSRRSSRHYEGHQMQLQHQHQEEQQDRHAYMPRTLRRSESRSTKGSGSGGSDRLGSGRGSRGRRQRREDRRRRHHHRDLVQEEDEKCGSRREEEGQGQGQEVHRQQQRREKRRQRQQQQQVDRPRSRRDRSLSSSSWTSTSSMADESDYEERRRPVSVDSTTAGMTVGRISSSRRDSEKVPTPTAAAAASTTTRTHTNTNPKPPSHHAYLEHPSQKPPKYYWESALR